ncbi:NAD(P)H-binding protein [Paenibacillus sp. P96]|uniref:NAD(P)H-binding protein n=1 Tax=Paenibacillus zeirhizosphaerae TaxID=2987519 RepID=A0ABT9FVL7_9BACL|nr:NAD(P)H-binding protein [Paenibacillus sp. P96]MDP4098781.1 NAD(P)H-binding protein [Paenibacillus sp. P96]
MHILILGATGRVGSHIAAHALKDRHHVTALVRHPEKIRAHDRNLTVIQGDVLNQGDIVRAIHGVDVVISALNTDGTTTLSESMPLIIEAMHNEGIQRIITVGTAGILQSRSFPNVLRYQSSESRRKSTRAAEEQGETLEEAAIREVKEETGLEVELNGIFSVSEAFFEDRSHHTIFFTFRGNIVGGEINISFPEEIEEVTWIEARRAEKYIHIPSELMGLITSKSTAPYILRGTINHNT